jgi:hypothetical protein
MARIRTIKPEFPQSESMGRVSRDARLAFVEMWTLADDSGRLRGNSRMLASLLFPYDDDAPSLISVWLDELEREDCIIRYQGEDGSAYIQICNWKTHQKIDKPSESKIPAPGSRSLANVRESSRKIALDQGSRIKEGIKDQGEDVEQSGKLASDSSSSSEIVFECSGEDGSLVVNDRQLEVWKAAYPHLDVYAEVLKARASILTSEAKKNRTMTIRFLNNWLQAAKPPDRSSSKSKPPVPKAEGAMF